MECAVHEWLRPLPQDTAVQFSQSILDSVEIKRCKGTTSDFKPHVHNELSLGYILSGSTTLTLRDTALHYQAGDGVIIPPLMSHRCAPHNVHQWEYVMLFIRPGLYENNLQFPNAQRLLNADARKLADFISQLLNEHDPNVLEMILLDLLLEFGEAQSPEAADPGTIEQVRDYLAAHPEERISLAKLETLSGLNQYTLIRNFKKAYVTTPASFHLQCRIAEAKKRLQSGCDVLTLCHDLHFYDQAHFIREFKQMYGVTPSAYTHH